MLIGEACNRKVIIVGPEAAIDEVARLKREYHVGNLIVVDESSGKRLPGGIVSDRDLVVEILAEGIACLTAGEDDELFDTLRRMRERGVRRAGFVMRDGAKPARMVA